MANHSISTSSLMSYHYKGVKHTASTRIKAVTVANVEKARRLTGAPKRAEFSLSQSGGGVVGVSAETEVTFRWVTNDDVWLD